MSCVQERDQPSAQVSGCSHQLPVGFVSTPSYPGGKGTHTLPLSPPLSVLYCVLSPHPRWHCPWSQPPALLTWTVCPLQPILNTTVIPVNLSWTMSVCPESSSGSLSQAAQTPQPYYTHRALQDRHLYSSVPSVPTTRCSCHSLGSSLPSSF